MRRARTRQNPHPLGKRVDCSHVKSSYKNTKTVFQNVSSELELKDSGSRVPFMGA